MKLSISNIAWSKELDGEMYQFLKTMGYQGLEIAPTRIFPENPYNKLTEASDFASWLKDRYCLEISSMQSIWYGRQEKIFGSEADRKALMSYTRKACVFAKAVGCKNLVFGCPRNRETTDLSHDYPIAIDFFHALGEMALEHDTTIAMEANPTIYNTHFINYTTQAIELVDKCNTEGLKVNVDLGTIIYNGESIDYLNTMGEYINHIHISEPGLKPISFERKKMHADLLAIAKQTVPNKYVSIEMGSSNVAVVKETMEYVKKLADEQD